MANTKHLFLGTFLASQIVFAGDVEIKHVFMHATGDSWRASVTLKHGDTGWDHYADAWRVVDGDGNVLGTRILHHPHEHEQPFTRSLGGIKIPANVTIVFIEAKDKVHGWSSQRVKVDLNQTSGEHYEVRKAR